MVYKDIVYNMQNGDWQHIGHMNVKGRKGEATKHNVYNSGRKHLT